jgi:hypothetical protein
MNLSELDRYDIEATMGMLWTLLEQGKADADMLRYGGTLLLSLAEKLPPKKKATKPKPTPKPRKATPRKAAPSPSEQGTLF